MIWVPIATAVIGAIGMLGRKVLFAKTRMPTREFLTTSSVLHAIVSLLLAWLVLDIPSAHFLPLLEPKELLVGAAYVVVAATSLHFFYQGFREESVARYELTAVLDPLFIFLMAGLVFPDERDLRLYVAAAIALGVFAFVHLRGRRIQFDHGERILLLTSFLFGIEAALERSLLDAISPFELYLVRAVTLAVAFTLMYGFHLHKHLLSNRFLATLGIVVLALLYTVGLFTAYAALGVTVTNIVLLLLPVLMYLGGHVVLREQAPPKLALAGAVILGVVGYALWVTG